MGKLARGIAIEPALDVHGDPADVYNWIATWHSFGRDFSEQAGTCDAGTLAGGHDWQLKNTEGRGSTRAGLLANRIQHAGSTRTRRSDRGRTPTRTPTASSSLPSGAIRSGPCSIATCTGVPPRTQVNALPETDTEEVTGSIPVWPTTYIQVSGARPTWERAASHMPRR
jgi:hypothetical protein